MLTRLYQLEGGDDTSIDADLLQPRTQFSVESKIAVSARAEAHGAGHIDLDKSTAWCRCTRRETNPGERSGNLGSNQHPHVVAQAQIETIGRAGR